jgi:hypothetical protein
MADRQARSSAGCEAELGAGADDGVVPCESDGGADADFCIGRIRERDDRQSTVPSLLTGRLQ